MRRHRFAAALIALACIPCLAREFRLVESDDEAGLERSLNESAGSGFRLVASALGRSADGREQLLALMARDGPNAVAPAEFRLLTTGGDLDSPALDPINTLAARSFAVVDVLVRKLPDWWLPEENYGKQVIWILAREAGAARRHYALQSLAATDRFEAALAKQPLAAERMLAAGRRAHALLGGDDRDRAEGTTPYRVLVEARRHRLRLELTRASKEGYAVVDAVASTVNAPPILLLKRRPELPAMIFKIVSDPLELHRRGRLSETLTALGREGFTLLPRTLLEHDWIGARPSDRPAAETRLLYRLISSRDGDPAARASEVFEDGFEFVALLTAPAERMILMRRVDDAKD